MDVNETRESRSRKKSSRLPRIENNPDNKPIVSGIIVTCRSALAISRSLVASDGGPVVSHTWHPVGDCITPSRSQCNGAGDRATAHRFMHLSCPRR